MILQSVPRYCIYTELIITRGIDTTTSEVVILRLVPEPRPCEGTSSTFEEGHREAERKAACCIVLTRTNELVMNGQRNEDWAAFRTRTRYSATTCLDWPTSIITISRCLIAIIGRPDVYVDVWRTHRRKKPIAAAALGTSADNRFACRCTRRVR